ncbi:helix-turn-helix domain-containing protein [Cellulomonas sp. ACRRI]|uniref:AraC family transcriptional regulator n=1 Tax=Cellulomonas sp. ACRRI TaxID=2918188 RepID=UPI001EF1D751|nr:helix-turn-helix domain-containing protein [Cellulomonas sp. ACRRI]MCG7286283.1 helix-turn-helix domain-containing protein [Cellulomonas sp. ACRRI]
MVESAGHLNPGDPEVAFSRFRLGADLDDLVRHVWVARWDVPAGAVRPQRVLTYPSANAVLQPAGAALHGPSRVLTTQDLTGRSWVVGVLLRPAACRLLTATDPARLVGRREPLPGAPLPAVAAAMGRPAAARPAAEADREVAAVLRAWLAPVAARVDDAGRLANAACRVAEERADVLRVSDLAALLGTTTRTLSRVVRQHTGLTPKWLIECRRLQAAATTLFADPGTDLAALAADLGYTDQAHFTRRYRAVVGETPARTRRHAPAPA